MLGQLFQVWARVEEQVKLNNLDDWATEYMANARAEVLRQPGVQAYW